MPQGKLAKEAIDLAHEIVHGECSSAELAVAAEAIEQLTNDSENKRVKHFRTMAETLRMMGR